MAKRRRLTPAASVDAAPETGAGTEGDPRPELETKARFPLGVARTVTRQPRAPIASVAGDAANRAAFDEVAGALASARAEGRLVQRLPLAAVEAGHLVRDRVALDEAEMETLMASLGARGQQTPVEVVAVGEGRWGLISGWRRLEALRRIGAESVLAFVREPAGAADAYLAMVEENEVRAGLSFYERARIAAEAVRLGLHPDASAAVGTLFASARPAKRSKILSFVALHEALGPALRFPAAIPEKLGLALAGALQADPGLGSRLTDTLRKAAPDTADAERAVLERATRKSARPDRPATVRRAGRKVAPGIFLETAKDSGAGARLTLSGPGVDAALVEALTKWFADR